MPTLGTIWEDEGSSFHEAAISNVIPNVPANKASNEGANLVWGPIIPDFTVYPTGSLSHTLRDIVSGQDWRLKSIVGQASFFITGGPADPSGQTPYSSVDYWQWVQVCLGFFVARSLDGDETQPDLTQDEIDPFGNVNIRNSWIFRRTWILGNPFAGVAFQDARARDQVTGDSLFSNRDFAGDMSGPTIRTKSVRRIKTEERLWYVVGALGWDGGRVGVAGAVNQQPGVKFNLDLRVFGQMARAAGRSTF